MGGVWTIFASIAAAAGFGWQVSLVRLFPVFQPMVVATSIMIAAILVRLNRGMPTLDWKALKQLQRERLTSAIVSLTREYLGIFALNISLVLSLLVLQVIGEDNVRFEWHPVGQRAVSALIGGLLTASLLRMAYVVWRDYDIVRLQKKIIDSSPSEEEAELEIKSADQKILKMKNAGLRKIESPGPRPF
jgi:hypothetical protein